MSVYSSFSTRRTAQTEPTPLRNDEVRNSAGGFVFELTPMKRLERFLMLGAEGGTFYVGEQKLLVSNASSVVKAIESNGKEAVDLIVNVSTSGRAAKNDPALFALALAASSKDVATRAYALSKLGAVARIPTHLFHFLTYVQNMRGWGRALRRAVAQWYLDKPVDDLAYQMVKYQSRDGWSNADALRLSHPKTDDSSRNAVYKWALKGIEGVKDVPSNQLPMIIHGFELAKKVSTQALPDLIGKFNLSREMLPTESLTRPEVWSAMLPKMGLEAMLRNLGNMTRIGVLTPLSASTSFVVESLTNAEKLRRARLHPYAILVALKTYESGGGYLSDNQWTPTQQIVRALNEAFYASFEYVERTGKRFLVGLDVSLSMTTALIGGRVVNSRVVPGLISAAEGGAALAMTIARTEPNSYVHGFCASTGRSSQRSSDLSGFRDLGINPSMSLKEILAITRSQTFGGTDAAIPVLHAIEKGLMVDCFVVITDCETWAGKIKPFQALQEYRSRFNPSAKMVVIGMTSTGFTLADPSDAQSLDIAGMDASIPAIINQFVVS